MASIILHTFENSKLKEPNGSMPTKRSCVKLGSHIHELAPEDRKIGSGQPITTIELAYTGNRMWVFVTSEELVRLVGDGSTQL